ncbi:MAG: hypothetical protein HOO67_04155 [Candidatus Peribacteraceae bacterium]|nr:hypothetical protein [Candidatus Peribacteraceae bacterium]
MRTFTHNIRAFALVHDDVPAFHVACIVLTVLAAMLLNTGAFAVLIAAHAALDIVKYRDVHAMSWAKTLAATFREALLDLFFLSLALCFALYLHHGQSIFVLSRLVHTEEILLRVFGIGLARLEVLLHGFWVFSNVRQHLTEVRRATGTWRSVEVLCLCGFVASMMFIAMLALVMEPGAFQKVFLEQMVPWRI